MNHIIVIPANHSKYYKIYNANLDINLKYIIFIKRIIMDKIKVKWKTVVLVWKKSNK